MNKLQIQKGLYSTIKIWNSTLKNLRFISGLTEKSMVEILDKLVNEELKKVKNEKTNS